MLKKYLNLFKRITTSGSYIPEIDGLRFVAISTVICIHILGIWTLNVGRAYDTMSPIDQFVNEVVMLGGYGVELFFMISGFVLAMPFCKSAFSGGKPVCLKNYLWRRVTRLEPPYVLSMLFYFLMMPQLGKGSYGELLPNLGASLVYLHNFIYHAGSVINNNAWSLEVEIQFYILVPVLLTGLRFTSLTRRTTLILFVVLFSINRLWLPVGMPVNLLQYFQYFLIGILLCEIRENHWLGCPKRYRYDILGLVAWPLFFVVNFNCSALTEDVFNPLLIGMFFVSALRGVLHGRVLSWSWIPLVGGMCYSIYLLHARILSLLLHKCFGTLELTGNFTADLSILILVAFPIVIGLSSVFFLLIEKPCMKPNWPSLLLQWFKASRAK